jgi:hypothetical protein
MQSTTAGLINADRLLTEAFPSAIVSLMGSPITKHQAWINKVYSMLLMNILYFTPLVL